MQSFKGKPSTALQYDKKFQELVKT